MEITIQLETFDKGVEFFGTADKHLKFLRQRLDVQIVARGSNIKINGSKENVKKTTEVIDQMQKRLIKRGTLSDEDVKELLAQVRSQVKPKTSSALTIYSNKGVIEPFTKGQLKYIETMLAKDLTFCIGPAGTGKTYLAVAVAVSMLKKKQTRKIVLARPAVEAGERLGFLPGDMLAKVNPYLRPLFDALEDMLSYDQMKKFMEMDIIEVVPLAFMRGRTLNDAVIICDEAQNTIPSQMLMFLTRMGQGSKMIITGDITQVDLEAGQTCGLVDAIETLGKIRGIGLVELTKVDIVRHKLVQNIVQAYHNKNKAKQDK